MCYTASGFILKNNDAMPTDLQELIAASDQAFVQTIVEQGADRRFQAGGRGGRGGKRVERAASSMIIDSIGSKFHSQLNVLMAKVGRRSKWAQRGGGGSNLVSFLASSLLCA